MKKAYLDHKDFKSMAKGLRGSLQYAKDAEAYQTLLQYVQTGHLTCYFSALHVLEAVRYEGSDPDEIQTYCNVLESLTQGRSIVWIQTLEERELKFFVQNHYDIPQGLSLSNYAYGDYLDAFPDTLKTCQSWAAQFKTMWANKKSEIVKPFGKTRNERRILKKRLPSLGQFTVSPEMVDSIPQNFRDIFTPEVMTEFVRGAVYSDNEVLLKTMRRAMTFQALLSIWKGVCPDLERMGKVFDDSGQQMVNMVSYNRSAVRQFGDEMHRQAIDRGRSVTVRMLAKHFSRRVHQLFPDRGIKMRQLEEALVSTDIRGLPSWDVALALYYQYILDNVGSGSRKVLGSDVRDILHMRCLPYVDFIVTDRYFAELARRVKGYGTKILRNVHELVKALKQSM